MYTAGKVSTCPDWRVICPVGHVTTEVYVPWDRMYVPRAYGHALMLSPAISSSRKLLYSTTKVSSFIQHHRVN